MLRAQKNAQPIVCLTAYTHRMAQLLDPHVDILLVGDSLGMVVYGFESTLPVTLEMMLAHGAAVVRGRSNALVVVDMPFASYQQSPQQAFANAARILQETGAEAVKLEGGAVMAETIEFLTSRGIPVMGHIGVTPQAVHQLGGYGARGKNADAEQALLADAQAIAEAGAFSIVLEGVIEPVAEKISQAITIPTIGIGASVSCDGQVLVTEDMLGMYPRQAKFVKNYANLRDVIAGAAGDYAAQVRARSFPGVAHVYKGSN
jgi:3-methyl-2-oxobutanoate hydroxymethyltransferase